MAGVPGYTKTIIRDRAVAQTFNPQAISYAGDAWKANADRADIGIAYAEKEEKARAATWLNETQISSHKKYLEDSYAKQKANEANPHGFAAMVDKDFEKADEELSKSAPNEEAKQLYLEAAARKRLAIYEDNLGWERQRNVEMMDASLKTTGRDLGQIARQKALRGEELDPDLFKQADATTVAAGQVYAPEKVAEFNRALHDEINAEYVQGLIESDPDKAIKYLDSGKFIVPGEKPDFDVAYDFVHDQEVGNTGNGYVENDGGSGPTIYGVNSKANPAEFKEIIALEKSGKTDEAREKGKQVFKKNYWDEIGADDLSGPMALVALDGAVNQGAGWMKKAIEQSGGDPNKLIDIRRKRYEAIAAKDPSKAKYLNGWMRRLSELEDQVNGGLFPGEDVSKFKKQAVAAKDANEAQAKADLAEKTSLANSRLDLMIESAETPDQFIQVEKQIEEAGVEYGEEWANEALLKVEKKRNAFIKEQGSIALGAAFVSGEATLNPENADDKKGLDAFYRKAISTPEMAEAKPDQRNDVIADILSRAKFVPDTLKGEISAAAVSQDPETITQLADLVDKVSIKAPQLMPMLGNEKSLLRVDMINQRINSGADPKEAIQTVDEQLDPRNKPSNDIIDQELKKLTSGVMGINFRDRAVKSLRTYTDYVGGFGWGGMDNSPAAQPELDAMASDYRMVFEDTYRLTRNTDAADHAAQKRMKLYGRTSVNPSPMITKFPIERYYNIENQDSTWIRDQAIKDAKELLPDAKDIKSKLYIVADPDVTPRTANEGQPLYKLLYLKDGVPVDVLGLNKYWKPDEALRRTELVKASKKPKSKLEGVMVPGSTFIK